MTSTSRTAAAPSTPRTLSGAPVLLLDMDGVLAQWTPAVIEQAARIAADMGYAGPLPQAEQITNFNVDHCFYGPQRWLVHQAMTSPGLYRYMEPVDGAVEAVKELRAADVHVMICSSPDLDNPTCADDKLWWLRRHLGYEIAANAVLTKDKTAVTGHLLVDDKPNVRGQFTPSWRHVIFTHRYNEGLPGLRLDRWADWPVLLDYLGADAEIAS